jgi:hypothetical protein
MEQSTVTKTRTRRTQQQIGDLLAEFDKGNFTVKEFCRLKGVSYGNFHKWKSRLKNVGSAPNNSAGFARLLVHSASDSSLFAEVKGIRLFQPVSAAYLKELLA